MNIDKNNVHHIVQLMANIINYLNVYTYNNINISSFKCLINVMLVLKHNIVL